MNFFSSTLIQELCGLTKLRSANNGIINEEQALALDQFMDRDQLHMGDQVTGILDRWHEGARPGRCVFNERTGKWNAGFIGISNRMGNSGIGHTSYRIRCHIIPLCHTGSTVTAHLFYTDTLVDAGRISIIDPQKCTDLHILSGSSQCTDFLRCHYHNLAGTKFPFGFITQIQISKAFKCYTISIFLTSDDHRCSSHFVTGSVDTLWSQ